MLHSNDGTPGMLIGAHMKRKAASRKAFTRNKLSEKRGLHMNKQKKKNSNISFGRKGSANAYNLKETTTPVIIVT